MSFHFKHHEPLADGTRRVVSGQIESARQLLTGENIDREVVVHEARKCFKRIRATLHLIDFDPPETFEEESRRYRNMGRMLASQRDADTLPKTFDKLIRDYTKHLEGLTLSRERSFIIRHAEAILGGENFSRIKSEMARELEKAKSAVSDWQFKKAESLMVTSIAPSVVKKAYSRSKDNFLTVCQNPSRNKMHNWRKRIKDLLYQSQLLSAIDLKFSPAYSKKLDNLAEWLGEHHDLTLLHEVVSEHGPRARENLAVEGLVELIAMEQSRLEDRAREVGGELFRQTPAAFIKHLDQV